MEISIEDAIDRAINAHQLGDVQSAEKIYKEILKMHPNHADANHNLGILAVGVGKANLALPYLLIALQSKPNQEQFWISYIYGLIKNKQVELAKNILEQAKKKGFNSDQLKELEKHILISSEESELQRHDLKYSKQGKKTAEIAGPSEAELRQLLDLYQKKQYDPAEKKARELTQQFPNHEFSWKVLGELFKNRGMLKDALAAIQKAVILAPKDAEAHNNLGVVLHEIENIKDAETSYLTAISLNERYPEAHANLGYIMLAMGKPLEALNEAINSLNIKRNYDAKLLFVEAAKFLNPSFLDKTVANLSIEALLKAWKDPTEIISFASRLLKSDQNLICLIEKYKEPSQFSKSMTIEISNRLAENKDFFPLLLAMLNSSQIPDIQIEKLLTKVRMELLVSISENISENKVTKNTYILYCCLAQQCFINEYIYFQTEEEIKLSLLLKDQLIMGLEKDIPIPDLLVIAVACYFPLYTIPFAVKLLDKNWIENIKPILRQQVQEPFEELNLKSSIFTLTNFKERISLLVQNQYEQNPYPRWVRLPKDSRPLPFNQYIKRKFRTSEFKPLDNDNNIQILVAGSGTGRQPIQTSQSITNSTVLALDLSMTSLSYAKRKTVELGLKNIEYAQADLLELRSLGRTFDLIESSGVLHHLEKPFAGWEVLLSLLKPFGLMKLGFYSELARRDIVKVRNMIIKEGIGSSAQEIRNFRKRILEIKGIDNLSFASRSDFFSTSSCRDLLFHVQEHRMTLPILAKFLQEHDLNFLGFEIDSSVMRSYKNRFPDDPTATNLNNWHAYEEENPDTFLSMYQFWIQKNT